MVAATNTTPINKKINSLNSSLIFSCFLYFLTQLTHHIKKEVFDWWEETTTGRVEWRYSIPEHGVLFQTPHGPVLMLQLCVDNFDIPLKVNLVYAVIFKYAF